MSIFYIRTLVDMAGVLILTVQHEQLREAALHSELTAMDNVLRRQYEQYRQSKENIRLINRRYHELKMQIAAIRAERDQAKQDAALAEMESGIRQYEAENKTGNPVLDTLLTAKTLYCQQHGINLTCVADGTLLHFLTTGEICTIVGTVLDNATESVLTEPDPEKRLIRAAIYAQNGFVMLRFENYCADPVELGPDGLPARSSHGGYDLKSVRAAAEAHGGTLTLHWENEWFTVRILLPQSLLLLRQRKRPAGGYGIRPYNVGIDARHRPGSLAAAAMLTPVAASTFPHRGRLFCYAAICTKKARLYLYKITTKFARSSGKTAKYASKTAACAKNTPIVPQSATIESTQNMGSLLTGFILFEEEKNK